MADDQFLRTKRGRSCPVCGKCDWCMVSTNGRDALCQRVRSDDRRGEAGWLHKPKERPVSKPRPKKPSVDWLAAAKTHAANLTQAKRDALCRHLDLPTGSLDIYPLLGYRDDEGGKHYTFPEWAGDGTLVGLCRRYKDGGKFQIAGGGRGLSVPHGFNPKLCDLVFVVEGPTDVAAMAAAGLKAVGRPNNTGGAYEAAHLLADCPDSCRIVVVGENDRKADHLWPGLDGAATVADQMAFVLQRRPGGKRFPVTWAVCPDGAKDVRAWLTDKRRWNDAWTLRGELLANLLLRAAVAAEPVESVVRKVVAECERMKGELAEVRAMLTKLLAKT